MVDRILRPVAPLQDSDDVRHRRAIAMRANACMPKDGSEGMAAPLRLQSMVAADLPDAALWPGAAVYVSDEDTVALSDGTNWDRLHGAGQFATAFAAAWAAIYSIGSWTPALNINGSATGITFSTQAGEYTKIGTLVVLTMQLTLTSNGAGTGAATITGVPFAADGDAPDASGFLDVGGGASISGGAHMSLGSGASTIELWQTTAGDRVALTDTNIDDNTSLRGTLVYRAAS